MNNLTFFPIPDGYRIRFQHLDEKDGLEFFADEGRKPPRYITFADLYRKTNEDPPNWVKVEEAQARCSHRDTPTKFLGRLISQNRVLIKYFGRGAFRGNTNNG